MNINIKKIINSRYLMVILVLFLAVLTVITGTYAWFTWTSTENTELTMTIGKFADVVFTSGNDITTGLTPVFDYSDGESTTFSINNKSTESLSYIVKLNIDTIDPELISSDVKYALVKNDRVLSRGDLSRVSNNTSIDICNSIVTNGTDSLIFYIYIDGNVENDLSMINKTITGTITVEEGEITPLSDFTYYLGSEYSTVNTINYYYGYSGLREESITPISLQSNEILLVQYNGESTDVVVPDTYVIDDVTYNVIIFSGNYIGVFPGNNIIESVVLGKNIKTVSDGNFNSMVYAFYECSNLISVPEIPYSVTDMRRTFEGCTSLVNAPEIPDSVTDMYNTFLGCTSLVNAPEIPDSVTDIAFAFAGCTSLTGTVRINSSKVTNASYIFSGTSKPITVEVPAGSQTYTKLDALTASEAMPSNVKLSTY